MIFLNFDFRFGQEVKVKLGSPSGLDKGQSGVTFL